MPQGIGYGLGSDPKNGLLSPGVRDPEDLPGIIKEHGPVNMNPAPNAPEAGGFKNELIKALTGLGSTVPMEDRRQALLQAGLAGLAQAGQPGATFGQTLAAIGGRGQQAGQMIERERELEQAASLGPAGSLTQLHNLFSTAVQTGDTESARALATVINAAEAARRPVGAGNTRTVDLRDPETGRVGRYLVNDAGEMRRLGDAPVDAESVTSSLMAPKEVIDPETGERRFMAFDKDARRFVPVEGAMPTPPGTGRPTEGMRKAAAFLEMVPRAQQIVDEFVGSPGRVQQALSDQGIREFTNVEQQRLNLAGKQLAEAWLRMTTGAAYNDTEFNTAVSLFVPQAGDKAQTLRDKRLNREALMRMLRTQAGSAAVDSGMGLGWDVEDINRARREAGLPPTGQSPADEELDVTGYEDLIPDGN